MKNLGNVLGEMMGAFLKAFYAMNNCVGKKAFQSLWESLLATYPAAARYLNKELGGENMQRWGLPWQVSRHLLTWCFKIVLTWMPRPPKQHPS
jgi:hypothetical protein